MTDRRPLRSVLLALALVLLLAVGVVWRQRQRFLVHACRRGEVAMIAAMIRLGADPDSAATGGLALYAAAWEGQAAAAAALLAHGAAVNAADPAGLTALHAAAARGHDPVVRLLLAHGADPARRAACGTARDVALANGHAATAALLPP